MAKDQLPSVSGAKLDDEILMGKDFYNDLDRFLSKPPPSSARSGRDLPTLEKLKRERKKIKASMRKSRETSTMNLRGRVSSKIDTGTRSSHKENAKPFDYALVRVFDFAFSLNSHTHTHTHILHKQTACRSNGLHVKYKINKNNCKYRFNDGTENECEEEETESTTREEKGKEENVEKNLLEEKKSIQQQ